MKRITCFFIYALLFAITFGCEKKANPDTENNVRTGADVLIDEKLDLLKDKGVGIVTNHSAVTGGKHLIDILHQNDINITALFGPEHGIRGEADAGEKIENDMDEMTGAPIYSLYGENRKPSTEMLENVDVLVFDIQDIGARFYTYTSTLGYAMQAAAENNIPFIVLDRPNPLGGELVGGFVMEPGFESFVGLYPIPVAHGLTVGELATMIKEESMLDRLAGLDLTVVQMKNWQRNMLWPETDLDWIPPSPNIPDFETALIYPGACFFEGTTASEGRGTMQPFVQLGAPWADGSKLAAELNGKKLQGLEFEAASFTPESIDGMASNPDWKGEEVHGVKYKITDPDAIEPVAAGVHVLHAFYKNAPSDQREDFLRKGTLQRLAGTNRLYDMLTAGSSAEEIIESWKAEVNEYEQMRRDHFLYN
jgi:uncharacterized protein YbbC (DUF1343 family)